MPGPKQLSNQRVSAQNINSSIAALHVVQLDSTGGIISGGVGGGSTQVSVREILTSSGASVMDSTNNAIGVTIRAGSAAGTEYTDGDVDATVSGQAILFDNSSNTLRPVTLTRGLPVNVVAGSAASTTVQVSSVGGVVLGRVIDRDQSTQVAAVLNTDPPSTTYGLAVRQVGAVAASTTVQVSSVGGVVAVAPASSGATGFFAVRLSDGSTFITDSTQRALRVTSVDVGGSTQVSVSTGSVRVHQSTAADLLVEPRLSTANKNSSAYLPIRITDGTDFQSLISGFTDGSTTSSLVAPGIAFQNGSNATMRLVGSTTPLPAHLRLSSGADIGDSTERAIRVNVVAGAAGGSTTVQVSSVGGVVAITPASSGATAFFAIRVSDGSTYLVPPVHYTDGSTTSTLVAGALAFQNGTNTTMRVAGSTTPFPTHLRTSSGADIGDSTERAIRVNVVAGAAGGSTEATVRQSTYTDFNTLSRLADRDNSTKVAAVLSDGQPASSAYGLVVRIPAPINDSTNNALRVNVVAGAAGGSTEVTVRQSTYTDFNTLSRIADRDQSTQVAAVLNGTPDSTVWALAVRQVGAAPTSTTVNVSSVSGVVAVAPASSGATGFFAVRVSDGSTFLQPGIEYTNGSTVSTLVGPALVYNNSSNDTMRLVGVTQPLPVQLRTGGLACLSTTALITSTHSTAVYALVSSAAGLRHKVFAFHVTSTHTNPSTLIFLSSAAQELWHVGFGSGSSGMTGANLAVTPPAFLFGTESQAALNVKIEGGSSVTSTMIARVSISYITEA